MLSMKLILKTPFDEEWRSKEPFDEVSKITGTTYRSIDKRYTKRFDFKGKGYFVKFHQGISFSEILKNLVSFRFPIVSAKNEWLAIHKLRDIGVNTMHGVAFGEKGFCPLRKKSFIITEEIAPSISLEDFCKTWHETPPPLSLKRDIIRQVANMTRRMHENGINHRDCYLCHFLLSLPLSVSSPVSLSIIDLHRAQIRNKTPLRWRNKDLVGLYFSSQDIGLEKTDYFFFLKQYFPGKSLREIFTKEKKFLSTLEMKAQKIRERTIRKGL